MEPIDQLFRRESGRMVSTLTRIFGIHNLALAEDVVQDAFCRAMEIWKLRGMPENPPAWLMTAAKNRALDALRRERTARAFAPELGRLLHSEWTVAYTLEECFSPHAIKDDQLRMMFSCCHPRLSVEAQIALILHILCGFSVDEIAAAFLSSHAAIEKRITRAKKTLAASHRLFDLSDADFLARLEAVRRALYLLFNEGYHGASLTTGMRSELCDEAMCLTCMLLDNPFAATPPTYALGALMYLHAARLPGRLNSSGDLLSLDHQDRSRWDVALVARGEQLLDLAARGAELTEYHVEAAIAAIHARAATFDATDWAAVVCLYDLLVRLRPSPVVALNRAIAIAQHCGPERGLEEMRAIANSERLITYPFYSAALGEMERRAGRQKIASEHFRTALALARSPLERRFLEGRIDACECAPP